MNSIIQVTKSGLSEPSEADLLEGWVSCDLGDHVYIAGRIGWRGLKAEEYTPSGPILLSVPNLNHGENVNFNEVAHISRHRFDESPEIKLKKGDTLLVKDGAGIGKLGFVERLPGEATINSSLLVVRPDDEFLLNKYLFYYLKGPQFQALALQRITGSATPHLFQKDIKRLRILVPPLAEQNRIVQRLESCLSSASKTRNHLSRVPTILKRFRQGVLAAACSGKLTEEWRETTPSRATGHDLLEEIIRDQQGYKRSRSINSPQVMREPDREHGEIPESWVWVNIETILRNPDTLSYGILKPGKAEPCGIPMLRVMDIGDWLFNDTEVMRVAPAVAAQYERTRLEVGDILLAVMATIGRVAVVPPKYKDANVNRALAVLKINPRLNPHFVCSVLRSPFFQNVFSSEKLGSAQSRINIGDLRKFSFPLPPVEEQDEIVKRIENLFHLASQIEEHLSTSSSRVNSLTQSILAKAFRGELVPTEAELARREGREYEPASVLLEKIKKERLEEPRTKQPRKSKAAKTAL